MCGGADSQNFGDIYQPIFQHKSSQMWVGGAYEARYKADFRFFEILVNMVNAVNMVNLIIFRQFFSSCL